VRDPIEAGEESEGLGQATIERRRLPRPRDPGQPVPERLAIGLVMEEDRIAEIPNVAPEERVRPSLVPGQPADLLRGQVRGPGGSTGDT